MNIFSPKNEENTIFFQETVAREFIKQKNGDLTNIRILHFLHKAATVSDKR